MDPFYALKYQRAKDADFQAFDDFCKEAGSSALTCTAETAADFIIAQTQIPNTSGRTKVHHVNCHNIAKPQAQQTDCICPSYQKHSSVHTLVKKLQAKCSEVRSALKYDPMTNTGNPFMSMHIHNLLGAIELEQQKTHVVTAQPVMMMVDKMQALCLHLKTQTTALLLAGDLFQATAACMTRTMVIISWKAWDRIGCLNKLLCNAVLHIPETNIYVFGHTWNKTLSAGVEHICGIRCDSGLMDPMQAMRELFCLFEQMGADPHSGYVFKHINLKTKTISQNLFIPQEFIGRQFHSALTQMQMFHGETLNGIRSGGAAHACLNGADLQQIMQQANWKIPKTAAHYIQLQKLLGLTSVPAVMSDSTTSIPEHHIRLLQSAMCAFPHNHLAITGTHTPQQQQLAQIQGVPALH